MGVRLAALLVIWSAATSSATACPLPPEASPELARLSPDRRLEFLHRKLLLASQEATTWSTVWIGANALFIAGQGAVIPFYAENSRPVLVVGIAATVIAAIPLVVLPLQVVHDGPAYDERVRKARPADQCALIAEGEKLLLRDSWAEVGVSNLTSHLINAFYNLGVGLLMGFAFHQWPSAVGAMASGFTIGEIAQFSSPRGLAVDVQDYFSGRLVTNAPPAVQLRPAAGAGVGFSVAF